MAEKILVVEDERNIASFVAMYLKNARYQVDIARDGAEALQKADSVKPDLVVLDLMLPDIDGLEVCRQIRSTSDVPILMLTARDDDVDKIVGLEVGADDYLTKPFNPRELVARVKSILRRATPERRDRDPHRVAAVGDRHAHDRALRAGVEVREADRILPDDGVDPLRLERRQIRRRQRIREPRPQQAPSRFPIA